MYPPAPNRVSNSLPEVVLLSIIPIIPINTGDNLLHIAIAASGIAIGLASPAVGTRHTATA